jgi:hypothetical protein
MVELKKHSSSNITQIHYGWNTQQYKSQYFITIVVIFRT